MFNQTLSKLEIIRTSGECLPLFKSLCNEKNSVSELYLDFAHSNYISNLVEFLDFYSGSHLKVLELRGMDFPIDLCKISNNCSNLETLRMMLDGAWTHGMYLKNYFPKLKVLHIKTGNPETLHSIFQHNTSVIEMHIHCPHDTKTKFSDSFIQSVCKLERVLPSLKKIIFHSKLHFGYNSTQRLIENLENLEYMGPMEMLPKLSKGDMNDLIEWVSENNWKTCLLYNNCDNSIFNIDKYEPWKYKYIPDRGRIPFTKEQVLSKRTSSCISFFTEEEMDEMNANGKNKRRSLYAPSQCSTRKSGSVISMKKSSGAKSVNLEDSEFDFEFAVDSDGFYKDKDYRMKPHQIEVIENDEDYDYEYEYDEFEEDTIDVEDLPEDADFEWAWGEDGTLQIYEIDKEEPQRNSIFEGQYPSPITSVETKKFHPNGVDAQNPANKSVIEDIPQPVSNTSSKQSRKANKRPAENLLTFNDNDDSVIKDSNEAFDIDIPNKAQRKLLHQTSEFPIIDSINPAEQTQGKSYDKVIDSAVNNKQPSNIHTFEINRDDYRKESKVEPKNTGEKNIDEIQAYGDVPSKDENEKYTDCVESEDANKVIQNKFLDKQNLPDIKIDHVQESTLENQESNDEAVKLATVTDLLVPSSSILKYDIPFFLGKLINEKPIPKPPTTKPPSLPGTVEDDLIASRRPSTVTKPKESVVDEEAKDWYWDYDEQCWKECDPQDEYEWEYMDSEEENKLAEVVEQKKRDETVTNTNKKSSKDHKTGKQNQQTNKSKIFGFPAAIFIISYPAAISYNFAEL